MQESQTTQNTSDSAALKKSEPSKESNSVSTSTGSAAVEEGHIYHKNTRIDLEIRKVSGGYSAVCVSGVNKDKKGFGSSPQKAVNALRASCE